MAEAYLVEAARTPVAAVGSDPVLMLAGPTPATEALLRRAGVGLAEIGAFEVNKAFASVVLAWAEETGADLELTNAQGGAIALGPPWAPPGRGS